MHFKALPVLLLSTAAIATANNNKRDIGDDIGDIIDDAITDIIDIGKSLTAVIPSATAIPGSIWSSLTEADLVTGFHSSLSSALADNKTPDWFKDLPSDAQSYLTSAYAEVTDELLPSNSDATATATGDAPAATEDAANEGEEEDDDDANESENAAPRPTGALMASLAGAAGIVGLAVAL